MSEIASGDTRNLKRALAALDQAEKVADRLPDYDDDGQLGINEFAAYGHALVDRAHRSIEKLSFYCTGSRLDHDLRRPLAHVRGRL